MRDFCFVIQPYDGGKFDQRYREILRPAIESEGLAAYRVDEDYQADVPIRAIERNLSEASLVAAEITTDRPNIWFELGYALAKSKPVILMCSDERTTPIPFDIRHRNILYYKTDSPSDFEVFRLKLRACIDARYTKALLETSKLTPEEQAVLQFLSRDQKTPYAMTEEGRIASGIPLSDTLPDSLKKLMNKRLLVYHYSTTDGKSYYSITEQADRMIQGMEGK